MPQQVNLNSNHTLRGGNSNESLIDSNLSTEHWPSSENTSIISTGSQGSRLASGSSGYQGSRLASGSSGYQGSRGASGDLDDTLPITMSRQQQLNLGAIKEGYGAGMSTFFPDGLPPNNLNKLGYIKNPNPKKNQTQTKKSTIASKPVTNLFEQSRMTDAMTATRKYNQGNNRFNLDRNIEKPIGYYNELLLKRNGDKERLIEELDKLVYAKGKKKKLLKLNDYGKRRKEEIEKRNIEIDEEISDIKEKMSKMHEGIKTKHKTFLSQKRKNQTRQNELNKIAEDEENELFLQEEEEYYEKILENLNFTYDKDKLKEIYTKALTEIWNAEMSSNSFPKYITLLNKYKDKISEMIEEKNIKINYTDELAKIEHEYNVDLKKDTSRAYQKVLSDYSSLKHKAIQEQKTNIHVKKGFTKKFLKEFILKLDTKMNEIADKVMQSEVIAKKNIKINYTSVLAKIEKEYHEDLKKDTSIAYQKVLTGYSLLKNKAIREQTTNIHDKKGFTKKILKEFILKLDTKMNEIADKVMQSGKIFQNVQQQPTPTLPRESGKASVVKTVQSTLLSHKPSVRQPQQSRQPSSLTRRRVYKKQTIKSGAASKVPSGAASGAASKVPSGISFVPTGQRRLRAHKHATHKHATHKVAGLKGKRKKKGSKKKGKK
tara:strand:+ start:5462 stop:7432 length:1971 start_codon:yes stop_codon:yes gene_type:complete